MSFSPAALMRGYIRTADTVSGFFGHVAAWMMVVACMLAAAVATLRYGFQSPSAFWSEAQWYLFGMAVMLGAPVLLRLNEHVRVDIIYGGRSPRTKAWIDIFGLACFLLPLCWVLTEAAIPYVLSSYRGHETSNVSALQMWPLLLTVPVGFVLLAAQGLAEIFKRVGFLAGSESLDTRYERPLQ